MPSGRRKLQESDFSSPQEAAFYLERSEEGKKTVGKGRRTSKNDGSDTSTDVLRKDPEHGNISGEVWKMSEECEKTGKILKVISEKLNGISQEIGRKGEERGDKLERVNEIRPSTCMCEKKGDPRSDYWKHVLQATNEKTKTTDMNRMRENPSEQKRADPEHSRKAGTSSRVSARPQQGLGWRDAHKSRKQRSWPTYTNLVLLSCMLFILVFNVNPVWNSDWALGSVKVQEARSFLEEWARS